MTQRQVANAITHEDLGTRERVGLMVPLGWNMQNTSSFKPVLLRKDELGHSTLMGTTHTSQKNFLITAALTRSRYLVIRHIGHMCIRALMSLFSVL